MNTQVTVRFWAGARRAAGRDSEQLSASSLATLRDQLLARPELAGVIAACSMLVDGVAGRDETPLPPGAVVDVLPPFAGG